MKRDVILAATADEEMGGARGMGWLVENHFDWIDAEYAINEAGGDGSVMGNRWVFRCQTAEKGGCRITLRAHGKAGHASTPRGETAISTLVAALDRLVHARLPHHLVPTVEATIRSFSQVLSPPMDQMLLGLLDPEREAEILDQMPGRGFAALYRASLHNTATPTILRAGTKVNVIPSVAEAELDCRLLPGQTADDLVSEIRPHLGDQIEIEVLRSSPGVESAYHTPFFETIGQVMSEIEPNSLTVPYMTPGGTDAKHLIRKGVKVYGFFPTKNVAGQPNGMELAHGTDERLALDNLRFSSQVLWEIVRRFCTR